MIKQYKNGNSDQRNTEIYKTLGKMKRVQNLTARVLGLLTCGSVRSNFII